MKTGKRIAIGLIALVLIILSGFLIYTADYYRADPSAIDAARADSDVEITHTDNALVFDPGNADTALIFYPGGKVESSAYQPLMIQIAQQGILCILPEMPFNLAVFDINAAERFFPAFTQVRHWYIGGHSLGGSMAASFAAQNLEKVEGLILIASYSASDLSDSGLRVLSIYGDQDRVLNLESYQNSKVNLPADLTELVLAGGNHAGFGNYGSQEGDGDASIPAAQQQADTARTIAEFCFQRR